MGPRPPTDSSRRTLLCVPVTATSPEAIVPEVRRALAAGADLVELRLDYLEQQDTDLLVQAFADIMMDLLDVHAQLVVTCRAADEGGHWRGGMERMTLLRRALEWPNGPGYVDVEYAHWATLPEQESLGKILPGSRSAALILSRHDFEATPADPARMLGEIAEAHPTAILKLACKANTIVDSVRMLEALRAWAQRRSTIALTMGETGVVTRVLARKLGAFLTFASLEAGKESAPGQISIEQMKNLYRWDAIRPDTLVYGVVGCPVAHSMSPAIHNAAFDRTGWNGVYLPFRVEPEYADFKAFLDAFLQRPWLDLRGLSVTIPHKENLLQYVREHDGYIEPLAARIGVANTLVTGDAAAHASLAAYNTDYRGALDALCHGMGCEPRDLEDARVTVLGAGGAARAIVAGLRDCGCRVTIYNRTARKARELAADFGCIAIPWEERHRIEADVVVNCTSIGMWPHVEQTPLPPDVIPRAVIFDTIYNPIETRLLRDARDNGRKTIDGVAMFVNQAAAQFRLWTGQEPPVDLMREVVVARLQGDKH